MKNFSCENWFISLGTKGYFLCDVCNETLFGSVTADMSSHKGQSHEQQSCEIKLVFHAHGHVKR